jgi:hypothetical protein
MLVIFRRFFVDDPHKAPTLSQAGCRLTGGLFETIDHDLQNQIPIRVFSLTRHLKRLNGGIKTLESVCDKLAEFWTAGRLRTRLHNLNAFGVSIGVTEDANDIDFAESGGAKGKGLDRMTHTD